MKTQTLLFLAITSLLPAQEKTKDPFIKDKKAPEAAQPADSPTNLTFSLETFTLPQADYATWLDSPTGRDQLHSRVLAAVKAGTARLDACHFVRGKSGQQLALESIEELMYPTLWHDADSTGFQYPAAFDMRKLGDRLELEATLEVSGAALDLNHSFERAHFLGFRPYKADTTLSGVAIADFLDQKTPSNTGLLPGVPALLGTHTGEGRQVTLFFATPQVLRIAPTQKKPMRGVGNLALTPRLFSLDRTRAWELLQKHPEDSAALLAEIQPLIATQDAVLEHISTITGKGGNVMSHESGQVFNYGTEFHPPTDEKPTKPSQDPQTPAEPARAKALAGTAALDGRALGYRWEVEPVLGEEGDLADISIKFSYSTHTGAVKDPHWNGHYPELPVFTNQEITTNITQAVGTTILISTLNPPGNTGVNGRKDEARVWLLFLETNLE